MNRFCASCGTPVPPGTHFCPECGQQIVEQGPQPAAAYPPPPNHTNRNLIIGAVAISLLLVVTAGLAVLFLTSRGDEPVAAPVETQTAQATPTPTPTPTAEATPAPTVTETVIPAPVITVTETAPPGWGGTVPSGWKDCGYGVYANSVTSCEFAYNVAETYSVTGGDTFLPQVYSPVTGLSYDMYCSAGFPTWCTGGNDAGVIIR